jgi:hypothetical protein
VSHAAQEPLKSRSDPLRDAHDQSEVARAAREI